MHSINVPLNGRSYPVLVGSGILGDASTWQRYVPDTQLVIVSNERVAPIYLEPLQQALAGRAVHTIILPDGEAAKSLQNWSRIIDELAAIRAGRDTCLIALGGGVIGDICGFAAASWMRGVDFIQFPTTLLAQVDASVGGKTAINHAAGKNLIGAFHQPRAVVADIATLSTLADREFRAGLAEVVKYGAIRDAGFITHLEAQAQNLLQREMGALTGVVEASVRFKAEIVAADELETGVRAILNFGHSFAHALETITAYGQYLHGEAVAVGMVAAAILSEQRGLCDAGIAGRLRGLLKTMQLPVTIPADISTADMLDLMLLDKKNQSGRRRLVLLQAPGRAMIDDNSSEDEIRAAIEACR